MSKLEPSFTFSITTLTLQKGSLHIPVSTVTMVTEGLELTLFLQKEDPVEEEVQVLTKEEQQEVSDIADTIIPATHQGNLSLIWT